MVNKINNQRLSRNSFNNNCNTHMLSYKDISTSTNYHIIYLSNTYVNSVLLIASTL